MNVNLFKEFCKFNSSKNKFFYNLYDKHTLALFIIQAKFLYIYLKYKNPKLKYKDVYKEISKLSLDEFVDLLYIASSDIEKFDLITLENFIILYNTIKYAYGWKLYKIIDANDRKNPLINKIFYKKQEAFDKNKLNEINIEKWKSLISVEDIKIANDVFRKFTTQIKKDLKLKDLNHAKVLINNNKLFITIKIKDLNPNIIFIVNNGYLINEGEIKLKIKNKYFYDEFKTFVNLKPIVSWKTFDLDKLEHIKEICGYKFLKGVFPERISKTTLKKIRNKKNNSVLYKLDIKIQNINFIDYVFTVNKDEANKTVILEVHEFNIYLENIKNKNINIKFLQVLNKLNMLKFYFNYISNEEYIDYKSETNYKFRIKVIYNILLHNMSRTKIDLFIDNNRKLINYKILNSSNLKLFKIGVIGIENLLNKYKMKPLKSLKNEKIEVNLDFNKINFNSINLNNWILINTLISALETNELSLLDIINVSEINVRF